MEKWAPKGGRKRGKGGGIIKEGRGRKKQRIDEGGGIRNEVKVMREERRKEE